MSLLVRLVLFCALLFGVLIAGRGQPVASPAALSSGVNGPTTAIVLSK